MISLTFPCSICGFEIRGEYEEEDFEYPVFCPKCGRQNRLPAREAEAVQTARTESQEPNQLATPDGEPAIAPVAQKAVEKVVESVVPAPSPPKPVAIPASSAPFATQSTPPKTSAAPAATAVRSRIAWRFRPAASNRPVVALRNCVAVDQRGRVLAALGSELFALVPGPSGCEVDWRFSCGDHIPGSAVIGPNGTVFVHSSDGLLHAVGSDGSPARPPTKIGPALGWATPLVGADDRVWVCAATGGLIRVDASGQTTARPFFRHPSRFDCTGAIRGDVLFVGCEDQFLHSVDLQGERGRDRWSQPEKIGLTGWYINSAIALDGGSQIVAVSRDDQMYSFDDAGAVVWKLPLNGRAIGSPVIAANGQIIVGLTVKSANSDSLSGRLVAVHVLTGQTVWRVDVDAPIESTPVVGNEGEIYFGDNFGRVHAVNGQGQKQWSESVDSAVRSAGTILSTGQVVFGLDDGSLVALRCASNSLGGPWPKLLATVENRFSSGK
jgi:outer membrane protein assembly factor BamB